MAEVNEEIVADARETLEKVPQEENVGFLLGIIQEIIYSPLNLALVAVIIFLIYKILRTRNDSSVVNSPPEPDLPKIRKDFTVQELKKYDGNQADGRVLVALNGHVYDVTKGRKFYGPGK